MAGASNTRMPKDVGEPDGQRSADRDDEERGAEAADRLEERHQQGKAWRVQRNDRVTPAGRREVAERRPRLDRQGPRRLTRDLLVDHEAGARDLTPLPGLADVAVRVGAAADRGSPVQRGEEHRQRRDESRAGRGARAGHG